MTNDIATQTAQDSRGVESTQTAQAPQAVKVHELTEKIRGLLEGHFQGVWVEGEISNLTRHGSGHWYFTLKDDKAQISAVMFRGANARVPFRPEAGMKVVAQGDVTVYPPRGNYQLRVNRLQPAGVGELQLAFEQLKKRLADEGLFDDSRKRPIPFMPRCVGVVTSPTGAAVRDIITVLTRRFPTIGIVLAPARVQGQGAAAEVVGAIEGLNALGTPDVLIVGRGGGSLEDLWAFNEEAVARAIHGSRIPVISAVGHETDFTIADFVADLRAPTPSAAAELAVPEQAALLEELARRRGRLTVALQGALKRARDAFTVVGLKRLFRRPVELVELLSQRLDDATDRMLRSIRHGDELRRQRLLALIDKVQMLNPVETLRRGFSVATVAGTGRVVRSVADVEPGDAVDLKVVDGRIRCDVRGRTPEDFDGQGKIF